MSRPAKPTYDLVAIQVEVRAGRHRVTHTAFACAIGLGFDQTDIVDCILQLDETDFYKTMAATKRPGLMQDVYKTTYSGAHLYVKVQMVGTAVVISFKEDESR